MDHFIKSNIETRFSSLLDDSHVTALFQHKNLCGLGIYLKPHQEHQETNKASHMILTVLQGSGAMAIYQYEEATLHLDLVKGDIIVVPPSHTFNILNTDTIYLMIAQITVR